MKKKNFSLIFCLPMILNGYPFVAKNERCVHVRVYMCRSLECLIAGLEALEQRKGWKSLQFETLLGIHEVLKCFLPREGPSQLPLPP